MTQGAALNFSSAQARVSASTLRPEFFGYSKLTARMSGRNPSGHSTRWANFAEVSSAFIRLMRTSMRPERSSFLYRMSG